MKKALGALVVITLVAIMVGSFIKNKVEEANEPNVDTPVYEVAADNPQSVGQGQVAPDFTLNTLDGESITLSELQGKKVVLNFWASWCGPCKEEMPYFQEYYEKYAAEDNVEIIAVNLTHMDKIEEVQEFVDIHSLTFPILMMEEKNLQTTYKVFTIPSTFMINTKGEIEKQILGPLDLEALRDYVTNMS
ncbi:MAG: redoxin domain-containing protein [Lysinibacillus sp.]|nr:redoxin domain-containing protein [Lysinibacillus sp.]